MNLGCDQGDWIDCKAGLPRQDAVVKTRTVLDRGEAIKWAFGPVDAWHGLWVLPTNGQVVHWTRHQGRQGRMYLGKTVEMKGRVTSGGR